MDVTMLMEKIQRNEELASIAANTIEAETYVLAVFGEYFSQVHLQALIR